MTNETEFKPGDVIMVKSGGPALTVLGVEGDKVRCLFFSDELGEFQETSLPAIALIAAEEVKDAAGEDEEDEDEVEDESDDEEEDEDQPGSGRR
jgi:uncharacterized protein YodC (DUF2158 family)